MLQQSALHRMQGILPKQKSAGVAGALGRIFDAFL
jgi:hypothetical protein